MSIPTALLNTHRATSFYVQTPSHTGINDDVVGIPVLNPPPELYFILRSKVHMSVLLLLATITNTFPSQDFTGAGKRKTSDTLHGSQDLIIIGKRNTQEYSCQYHAAAEQYSRTVSWES